MIVCKSATTIGYIPSKTLTTYVVIIVWEYIYIYSWNSTYELYHVISWNYTPKTSSIIAVISSFFPWKNIVATIKIY